jgi:chromosome segregation ATPase
MDRDDSHAETIRWKRDYTNELSATSSNERYSIDPFGSNDISGNTIPSVSQPLGTRISAPLDITSELDSLSISFQFATPQPPNLAPPNEASSISDILATISTTESIASTQQLLVELHTTRAQLTNAQTELQFLHQQNQAQVDRIDANILEVKQLKFRTQQLARYSKNQIEKVQEMLGTIQQIRTEIVTSLDKFGGYDEIHSMLAQLETTRHASISAHDALEETLRERVTGEESFYESLQAIQAQVAAQSHDSEHKLHQYQESIHSLSQTISIDRLRIAGMSVDLSTKLTNLHGLNAQITTMHAQVVGKSQTLQSRIAEIDRGFGELSQSVQQEKEQFYELTVEAIEKADAIRSQLADLVKQISGDRHSIQSQLKTEIESMRHTIRQETEQKLNNLDLRYHELISTWNDLHDRQKDRVLTVRKLSTWLWVLSFAIGVIFILLIRILTMFK